MVRVVVVDPHPVRGPGELEPPVHAGVPLQAGGQLLRREAEFETGQQDGSRVQGHVHPEGADPYPAQRRPVQFRVVRRRAVLEEQPGQPQIRRSFAVGPDPQPPGEGIRAQGQRVAIIGAEHQKAAGLDCVHETPVGAADAVEVAVPI